MLQEEIKIICQIRHYYTHIVEPVFKVGFYCKRMRYTCCCVLAVWAAVQKRTFISSHVFLKHLVLEAINHILPPQLSSKTEWKSKMNGNRLPLLFLRQPANLQACTLKNCIMGRPPWGQISSLGIGERNEDGVR